MRVLLTVLTVAALAGLTGHLQAQDINSAESVQRVATALQRPPSRFASPTLIWPAPEVKRFGVLTIVPPDTRGEMVKVVFPAGQVVMNAAHAAAAARHRRAERRAHDDVARTLLAFQAAQTPNASGNTSTTGSPSSK